jgi:chaperone modulatory protein CbpM
MTEATTGAIAGEPTGADPIYSLEELSSACKVETTWVVELVEHGIIEARGRTISEWRFSSTSVVQLAKAKRFDRDLGLNPAGIALVFDLLNQIDGLRARLNVLAAEQSSLLGSSHADKT